MTRRRSQNTNRASTQCRLETKPWTKLHAVRKFSCSNSDSDTSQNAEAEAAQVCEGSALLHFYFCLHVIHEYTRELSLAEEAVSNGLSRREELVASFRRCPDVFQVVTRPWVSDCSYKLVCGSYMLNLAHMFPSLTFYALANIYDLPLKFFQRIATTTRLSKVLNSIVAAAAPMQHAVESRQYLLSTLVASLRHAYDADSMTTRSWALRKPLDSVIGATRVRPFLSLAESS